MDLSKVILSIVVFVFFVGSLLLTNAGMNQAYENSTKILVGNDPDQDVIDEAVLSKYGGINFSMFRYEKAKKFYTASVKRYGENGRNYWWNLEQLAACEEKLGNDEAAVVLLHQLWMADGEKHDSRVSDRKELERRATELIQLNGFDEWDYPMIERRWR